MGIIRGLLADIFRSLLADIFRFLKPFTSSNPESSLPDSPWPPVSDVIIPFPQFAELPTELRLKIWAFALESRILKIHLHTYGPGWDEEEDRDQEDAPDDTENSSLTIPHDGPNDVLETEEYDDIYLGLLRHARNMVVTACKGVSPCHHCGNYPPRNTAGFVPPALFLVCHESRDVAIGRYKQYLDAEYNTRGLEVAKPFSRILEIPRSKRGIIINPSVDFLHVSANVASKHSIRELHHLSSIVVQQLPDISKVVIVLGIAMRPYQFWSSERFQYWKKFGDTAWWVPLRFLVRLKRLREVVLVVSAKDKMLPKEWKMRTEALWMLALSQAECNWPEEWGSKMPTLKFVENAREA